LPGSPAHLLARFFDVLTARGLSARERVQVSHWLEPVLAAVFFSQPRADQRHGHHAATVVAASGRADSDALVAALVHDVGKRHARLGVVGRSIASIMIITRLPLGRRFRSYRDHGALAARELGRLGAPTLAVDFALHHHGRRPATIDEATWDLLVAADRAPKPSTMPWRRITSTGK